MRRLLHLAFPFALLVILGVALLACSSTQRPPATAGQPTGDDTVGAAGLFTPKDGKEPPPFPSDAWDIRNIDTEPGGGLDAYFYLANNFPSEQEFLLLNLIDFEQRSYVFGGDRGDTCTVTAPGGGHKVFDFQSAAVDEGLHDFLTLLICQPFGYPTDDGPRLSSDVWFVNKRVSLNASSTIVPQLEYERGEWRQQEQSLDGIAISSRAEKLSVFPRDEARPGDTKRYFLEIGNLDSVEKSVAVFVLLDYKQVELKAGKKALYFKLPPRTITEYAFDLKAPGQAGVHELEAFAVYDPFDAEAIRKSGYLENVRSSIRTALTVE